MIDFKNFFINHLKGIVSRVMANPRRLYHKKKAKNCYRDKCSIICNNCTGGVILHDLGLKFDTPTINTLFYSADDFIFFVSNIREFSKCNVFKVDDSNYSYPVGGIKLNGRVVKIGFVHYSNFEEAKSKWIERFTRVDFENMIILWEGKGIGEKELNSLNALKEKKMVISSINKTLSNLFSFYEGGALYDNWFPGKILEYKNIFGLKRFLDDFDYISLINDGIKN